MGATSSRKQQASAGWNDISDKALSNCSPDLNSTAAFGLSASFVMTLLNTCLHFFSRSSDGTAGLEFQNYNCALPGYLSSPAAPLLL